CLRARLLHGGGRSTGARDVRLARRSRAAHWRARRADEGRRAPARLRARRRAARPHPRPAPPASQLTLPGRLRDGRPGRSEPRAPRPGHPRLDPASRRRYNNHVSSTPLEDKLSRLPDRPGVYLYKDAKAQVVYVGKASSLRSRVRSYFQESRPHDAKTDALVRQVADLEFIVTDNELEALMLEANLVRRHRPRYNII